MIKRRSFAFASLGASLALVASLALPGSAFAQGGPPPANVRVDVVTQEVMAPHLEVPGTIISRNDADISSEISGRVDWIAEVGAVVQQGEPIARLDQRMLNLQLQENEAEIRSLESSLTYQRAEANRLRELAGRNNAAASRVEEAVSTMQVTEQRLVQARVERDRTLYNIERSEIPAPFTGRVVERGVEVGEYASIGTMVARLVDTQNLEVTAQAPISLAQYMEGATELGVSRNGGLMEAYPIRTIVPVGDQVTRTFEIRVSLPEGVGIIGTPVRVAVPSDEPREVTAIPRDAIVLRSEGNFVFRITEEGTAQRVQIQVGVGHGDRVEAVGALSPGDQVIIRGAERIQDGQPVNIASAS